MDRLVHNMQSRGVSQEYTDWIEQKVQGRRTIVSFNHYNERDRTGNSDVWAGRGLKARAWAGRLQAQALHSAEPGPLTRLGLGQARSGLKPGLQLQKEIQQKNDNIFLFVVTFLIVSKYTVIPS
jgi:hypothetical protein